jgi:uncharacterized protein (DUF305 family)
VPAGCGVHPTTPQPAPAVSTPATASAVAEPNDGFNAADVMFLQMMVLHHGQGIDIARLAAERPVRAEVKTLAAAIETTQATEMATMADWLREWGQPATADPDAHAAHGGMPGTSPAEFAALRRADGAAFERTLLDLLIAHQDDAVQLARGELAAGHNHRVRDLARRIDLSRSAQVKQMLSYRG